MHPDYPEIFNLPLADQLRLVEDLWDHIAESNEPLPLSDWQKEELDRRRERYEANPDSGISWEELKKQIREDD